MYSCHMDAPKYFSPKRLGEALKYMRAANGLSLRDLAKLSGVSASHICRIEAGEWQIQLDTFIKVAMPLNVPCGLLLEEGIELTPISFLQAVKEDEALPGLIVFPKSLSQEEKSTRRAEIHVFLANLSVAAAYLCLSSDPIGTCKRIDLPFVEAEVPFQKLATDLASSEYTTRAMDFTEALKVEPVTFLIQRKIVSNVIVDIYVKMLKKHGGSFWSPAPKFI